MGGIVKIQLQIVDERLTQKHIKVNRSPQVLDELAQQEYDPDFGARPLKRLIHQKVTIPLSKALLASEIKEHYHVEIALDKG